MAEEYFYGDKRIIEKYYGDMVLYKYVIEEGGVKSYTEHFLGSTIPSSSNDFTTETRTLTTSTGSTATVYTGGWYWDGGSGIKNRTGNSSLARYKAEYIKFKADKKTKIVVGVASLPSATSTNRLDIFCSASQLTTTTALNGTTDRVISITSAVSSLTDYEFEVEAGDYYLTFSHRSQSTSTNYVATIDYVKFEEIEENTGGGDTGGSGKYVYQLTVGKDDYYNNYGYSLFYGDISPKEIDEMEIIQLSLNAESETYIKKLQMSIDNGNISLNTKGIIGVRVDNFRLIISSISDFIIYFENYPVNTELCTYLETKVGQVVEVELITEEDDVYTLTVGKYTQEGVEYYGHLKFEYNVGDITPSYYMKEENIIDMFCAMQVDGTYLFAFIIGNIDFSVDAPPIKIHVDDIEYDIVRYGIVMTNEIDFKCTASEFDYMKSKLGSTVIVKLEKAKEFVNKTTMTVGKEQTDELGLCYGFSDGKIKSYEKNPFGSISNGYFLNNIINVHSFMFFYDGFSLTLIMVANGSFYNYALSSKQHNAIILKIGDLNIDLLFNRETTDANSNATLNQLLTASFVSPDADKVIDLLADKESKGETIDIEFLGTKLLEL